MISRECHTALSFLSFWQLGVCQQYLNVFCIVFVQVFET